MRSWEPAEKECDVCRQEENVMPSRAHYGWLAKSLTGWTRLNSGPTLFRLYLALIRVKGTAVPDDFVLV